MLLAVVAGAQENGAAAAAAAPPAAPRLESRWLTVDVDARTGRWSLVDKRSGVPWPSQGRAGNGLAGEPGRVTAAAGAIRCEKPDGAAVVFELADQGRSLVIRYEGPLPGEIRLLEDALAVGRHEGGGVVVPCREGLWIPAGGPAFRRTFGASDYEGCHMFMLGALKAGSAMLVSWDDAYVFPEVRRTPAEGEPASKGTVPFSLGRKSGQSPAAQLTVALTLRRTARLVGLTPLGTGDWNTLAAGYRRLADEEGLAATLRDKIRRNPHAELLLGAANVKLWTCLARRMNDDSTKQEFAKIHWTFDEAARVAEHLRRDLDISRCLFILGGWTEGGYDCRHPDDLPANPECGGNDALADAVRRIQALGYVACLHDNYQDMYRNAKSWNPDCVQKHADGSLAAGGRWLGGRAWLVCSPKQLELAMRPQNLPAIHKLFGPWCYFIDCTYAVDPQECSDPKHPLSRNDDIHWKSRLSDAARRQFGLFGSEDGREWAVTHSDFFEGLVSVSGRPFHSLDPASLGATAVPFWEMVYHDCQVCYGKYGYAAETAAQCVAQHVLAARPLYYHSMPDHLYWTGSHAVAKPADPRACFTRTDQGWAEGLHPIDAFLKTTQEVLGPLHLATAHQRLTRLEMPAACVFAPAAGAQPQAAADLRAARYGEGPAAVTVQVNFGPQDAEADSRWGGKVLLPPWGFVIDGPALAAFYAKRWNGRGYADGALFTLQPVGAAALAEAAKVRIFHGFGDAKIAWAGAAHEVRRQETIAALTPPISARPARRAWRDRD
jgi:hypothetical protein